MWRVYNFYYTSVFTQSHANTPLGQSERVLSQLFQKCICSMLAKSSFRIFAITVPVHQRKTRMKLQDRQFVYGLHRFFSLLLRGRKKNSKFLALERYMLVWVLLKLLQLLICYLNTMADPSFQPIATCLSKAVDLLEPQSKSR